LARSPGETQHLQEHIRRHGNGADGIERTKYCPILHDSGTGRHTNLGHETRSMPKNC
jgi:hypothetical protein